ncbi:MAG: hexokinase [Oscillospiraceae bacterium]|nr:hexokinase [Oscillospiraceae bacterium]
MEHKIKAEAFMKKYGMHYEDLDFDRRCKDFVSEMENGLEGKPSSLLMLPTYLTVSENIPAYKTVIVMDAGGTNFRIATVTFDERKKAVINDFKVFPMLGTNLKPNEEVSADEFFNTIADELLPLIGKSNTDSIGFCFSYPTEILPNKDGKLIRFTKEIDIKGLPGLEIGAGINAALRKKGVEKDKRFVLLNDTVASMIAGISASSRRTFSDYIGFILGTGTNTSYIEKSEKISKIDSAGLPEKMGINIEAGGFLKVPSGDIDKFFDAATVTPGQSIYEKMISGAYLGTLIYHVINFAIREGLFSADFADKFSHIRDITMRSVDEFCTYPDGDNLLAAFVEGNEDDRLTLYYLLDAVFERTAKLVAVNIASVMLKTGSGSDPTRPVCVVAEGTTFYKSKLLRPKLDYYSKIYINDRLGLWFEFQKLDNATLIGTAAAALLN